MNSLKSGDIKLVKITDLIGREYLPESNKVLIYYYSDGIRVKTFK